MLGHIGVNVPDLAAARRYYEALLPRLEYERFFADDDQFAFMPANSQHRGAFLFFYQAVEAADYSRHRTGLQHLAFMVHARADVVAALDAAIELGSELVHHAKEWPQYPPPYFAAFWTDPFGIMIEAVCHHDR